MERPDLSQVSVEVSAYIEFLEAKLAEKRSSTKRTASSPEPTTPLEPTEPPTPINLVTIGASGMIKRTPRHFYERQRRGGMGIFDLQLPDNVTPTCITTIDENDHLLLITNHARCFRVTVKDINERAIHDKGQSLAEWFTFRSQEHVSVVVPDITDGYLIVLSDRGHLKRLRHHYFGSRLRPGTNLYTLEQLGEPTAACITDGSRELFIATQQGRGIRFPERLVPANGCLGIRLGREDRAIALSVVTEDSNVFLMGADGKGTIRQMSGFQANKAPGSGGKIAMKTSHLVGAFTVREGDDVFAISKQGKIIRFQADDVPPKSGTVQGVNCMALRHDETIAIANGSLPC